MPSINKAKTGSASKAVLAGPSIKTKATSDSGFIFAQPKDREKFIKLSENMKRTQDDYNQGLVRLFENMTKAQKEYHEFLEQKL